MRSTRERAFWDVPGARASGLVKSDLGFATLTAEVGRAKLARTNLRHEVRFMAC